MAFDPNKVGKEYPDGGLKPKIGGGEHVFIFDTIKKREKDGQERLSVELYVKETDSPNSHSVGQSVELTFWVDGRNSDAAYKQLQKFVKGLLGVKTAAQAMEQVVIMLASPEKANGIAVKCKAVPFGSGFQKIWSYIDQTGEDRAANQALLAKFKA